MVESWKENDYDPFKLWNNFWWKKMKTHNHRMRNDMQTDAPTSPSGDPHGTWPHMQALALKTRVVLLLHLKTKMLRYKNIVFIFIVAVAYFCCEAHLWVEYELGARVHGAEQSSAAQSLAARRRDNSWAFHTHSHTSRRRKPNRMLCLSNLLSSRCEWQFE